MAEECHHSAHGPHGVDNFERRRSFGAGRFDGGSANDGGLASHLERLSKQLDNIQAEHSQVGCQLLGDMFVHHGSTTGCDRGV